MNESRHLGKSSPTPRTYDPEILVAVPREENRKIYGIDDKKPPFTGVDVWHAYECSFLTNKGLPVAGILKICYRSDSPFIVESKSLKLYLNALNMESFGETPEEAEKTVILTVEKDLEALLSTPVAAYFFRKEKHYEAAFDHFEMLEELPGLEDQFFSEYKETPELLEISVRGKETLKVATRLLRSNCKITHQPDWGSIYIHLKGKTTPDKIQLLKYIVSLRDENHFHEEICEMVYKRLLDRFSPEKLMVTCIYARRGGIDICPSRASSPEMLPANLINPAKLTRTLLI
ncbi:MAG: NADPH-dependent 7-cyano-7-deazaguanine reductase QueF [Marinilabiliaceae bacterium]